MKKYLSLLLVMVAALGITATANAKVQYSFKLLSEEINSQWNLVFKKDGSGLYGVKYDFQEQREVVYDISFDGTITKTNLISNPYGGLDYDYYYITIEDGSLVRYHKTGYGIYEAAHPESSEIERTVLDDENNYVYPDPYVPCTVDTHDLEGHGINNGYCGYLLKVDNNGDIGYGFVNKNGIQLIPGGYEIINGNRGTTILRDELAGINHTVTKSGRYVSYSDELLSRYENEFGDMDLAELNVMGFFEGEPVFSYEANNKLYVFNEDEDIGVYNLDQNLSGGRYNYFDGDSDEDGYFMINYSDNTHDFYKMDGILIKEHSSNIPMGTPILGGYPYIFTQLYNGKLTISVGYSRVDLSYDLITVDYNGDYAPYVIASAYTEDGVNLLLYQGAGSDDEPPFYILNIKNYEDGIPTNTDDDDLILYKILEGKDQTFYKKAKKDIVIRSEGAFDKFWGVAIDGELVDEKYYTVAEGSTIVTLKANYLNTLKEGKHTVYLLFNDGYSETTLTVSVGNPPTVDKIAIMAGIFTASLVGVYLVCARSRKYD